MSAALALLLTVVTWCTTNLLSGQGIISDAVVVSIAAPIAFMVIRRLISLAG